MEQVIEEYGIAVAMLLIGSSVIYAMEQILAMLAGV